MPRETDPFRKHVKFLPNKHWNCNFCGNLYAGSATRIKAHLAGVGGYGINDCKLVNARVRSEALEALKGKTAVESSNRPDNVEEGAHQPVIASNEDGRKETSFTDMPFVSSNAISTLGASSSDFLPLHDMNVPSQYLPTQNMTTHGGFSFWTQLPQSHAGDSNIQPRNLSYPSSGRDFTPEALTNMPRQSTTEFPQDTRTENAVVISESDNCGPINKNMPSLKRKREERSNREVVDDFHRCSFRKLSMKHATRCRKSSPLLTTELRGKESVEIVKQICDCLMEDEIVIIGIYGMGGVGKTAILMHVHNKVLENPTFNDVFWVTVPQEFSVHELQDKIANVVGLDNLSKDKDAERRACILDRHLKQKKKSILLLDGMWMHFELKDVGIPIKKGGLKLVLTTRSLDVCHKMLCQKKIKIEPLSLRDDSWNLFLEKLCFEKEITSKVEKIARSIVDKCGGLPLGIIEIATCMRGVEEVHEWKGMLRKFKESRVELNVFKRLKLSYVNLGDSHVQQCFLNLTQKFQESQYFPLNKIELIESFIDEGLLDRIGSRRELHEQGNTILNKLRKGCLCREVDQCIYLHPLMRDMALHIVRSRAHMVKTYMGLKEIPEEKLWTDCLEKVSLQGNEIKEIPYGISPNCPKLMSLSLYDNIFLEAIHKSFFRHLEGLKVLNLSQTKIIELPNTISHLKSLEALLLRGCEELVHIPCVRKLGSLRKLDASRCAMLEEVPEGMEMLVKLSYLDLRGTKIKMLSDGVLGKLVNLQYLAIGNGRAWLEGVSKKVEVLYCFVSNVETFNAWVRFLKQNSSQSYQLSLNKFGDHYFKDRHERHIIIESCHSIAAIVDGEIGGDGRALLPKNVQALKVGRCDGVTSLCEVGPLDNLEKLKIEEWEQLKELGAVHFPRLRRLNVMGCSKLKDLLEGQHGLPRLQWFKVEGSKELEGINIAAPFLYSIEVYGCPKMKRVVEWEWLATRLLNLRSIKIKNCEKLEEIIGGPVKLDASYCLTKIEIEGCNNLKMVLLMHDMLLHLPFLRHVSVKNCKRMEVIIGTVPNMTQPSLNLTRLTLSNLPELKGICDVTVSCLSIESIDITNCPKLKRLPLLDEGLPHPPPSHRRIWIDPLTRQSLEFHGVSNWRNQRMHKWIESCDSIATRMDGEIGGDGRNLLPKNVQVLEVGHGSGVTSLSEVGPLENLEELTIEVWEQLEELGAVHFPQLQGLNVNGCPKLKHLLVEGQGLPRLQWFKVKGSKELEEMDFGAPNLNHIEVWGCPKLKRVVEWNWLATGLPKLKSIGIYGCEKLEQIIGGAPLPSDVSCFLRNLIIKGCDNIKGVLLTHDMLLHLPFLQQIKVENCKGIEVIIGNASNMMRFYFLTNLTRLTLRSLPKLKSICDCIDSCDNIQFIEISDCPKLKGIPFPLLPWKIENGLLSPPPSLAQILIDQRTWQALVGNYPLARISLEPFIEFIETRNYFEG